MMALSEITVVTFGGDEFVVSISDSTLVGDVKVQANHHCGIPPTRMELLHNGTVLSDSSSVINSGVAIGDTLHLFYKPIVPSGKHCRSAVITSPDGFQHQIPVDVESTVGEM